MFTAAAQGKKGRMTWFSLALNTGKHFSLCHIQGIKRSFFPLCFYLVITCLPLFYSSLLNSAIYNILFPQNRKRTYPGNNNVFNRLQSVSQFLTEYTVTTFLFYFYLLKIVGVAKPESVVVIRVSWKKKTTTKRFRANNFI